MKFQHLILAAGISLAVASCGSSKQMNSDYSTANAAIVVPASTQTAFITRYPTATSVQWYGYNDVAVPIDWELTDWPVMDANDYVVTYTMNGNKYYSWY